VVQNTGNELINRMDGIRAVSPVNRGHGELRLLIPLAFHLAGRCLPHDYRPHCGGP
jgi:hypothetical protein